LLFGFFPRTILLVCPHPSVVAAAGAPAAAPSAPCCSLSAAPAAAALHCLLRRCEAVSVFLYDASLLRATLASGAPKVSRYR